MSFNPPNSTMLSHILVKFCKDSCLHFIFINTLHSCITQEQVEGIALGKLAWKITEKYILDLNK